MGSAVKIEKLSFSYTPDKPVLKEVSLEVKPGEKLGIIGRSGAGKSTLLLHLNGILSGSGTVSIDGTKVEKKSLYQVRKKVGLVFQNPDDQLFNPTVEEDIAFGPLNFGLSREESAARVKEALNAMNLEGLEKSVSHHLSLGERKRVALATVLAMQPEVIAFDEPFSSLDPEMVVQLINIIGGLDATLVVVSQSLLPLLSCCNRLAVISEGEIIAHGPREEIVKNDELMKRSGMDMSFYREIFRDYF